MVDEDQYASIVERRRNEDDFVVDDSKCKQFSIMKWIKHNVHSLTFADGLGYHDDGEEHLGVGEDAYDGAQ